MNGGGKVSNFRSLVVLDNILTSCFDWIDLEFVLPIASQKLT